MPGVFFHGARKSQARVLCVWSQRGHTLWAGWKLSRSETRGRRSDYSFPCNPGGKPLACLYIVDGGACAPTFLEALKDQLQTRPVQRLAFVMKLEEARDSFPSNYLQLTVNSVRPSEIYFAAKRNIIEMNNKEIFLIFATNKSLRTALLKKKQDYKSDCIEMRFNC